MQHATPRLTVQVLKAILIALLFAPAHADASDHAAYCAGMYSCLQETPAGCSEEDCRQTGSRFSDEAYCAVFKDLQARGLRSTSNQGRQIYTKVSGKHRVEYAIDGTLPMSAAVIGYLMNNLPFAAQLVNAYQGTKYQAAYLDSTKKRFSGSGESLSGVFTTVLQNEQQTRSLYLGSGIAEVMVWRLRGTALVTVDFEEAGPHAITYRLRCMVFPHSLFVKSILNFILFRNAIVNVLDETVGFVQDSAVAFQRGEREQITNYPAFATPEGRRHIQEFQDLLQRTMGETEEPLAMPQAAAPDQTVPEPDGTHP